MNERVTIRQNTNYNDVCSPFDDKAQEKISDFLYSFFGRFFFFFSFHQLIESQSK